MPSLYFTYSYDVLGVFEPVGDISAVFERDRLQAIDLMRFLLRGQPLLSLFGALLEPVVSLYHKFEDEGQQVEINVSVIQYLLIAICLFLLLKVRIAAV